MTRRTRLFALAATLALLAAGTAACGLWRDAGCTQCGRDECRNLSFTISLKEGGAVRTCCPRCALRYIHEKRPEVASLAVRDFATAGDLDAREAVYVEGSDVHPCAHDLGTTPTDDRGCCLKTVYDRCEPSLVAFATSAEAEEFAKEHGGFLKTFEALALAELERR